MKITLLPIPNPTQQFINQLFDTLQKLLGPNLLDTYIHGSIAMHCFNPKSSDIDILVIVSETLNLKIKSQLTTQLNKLVKQHSQIIELFIVTKSSLESYIYPVPYDYFYSEDHADNPNVGTSEDLAAAFRILRKFGISLTGATSRQIFPIVPNRDYLKAIIKDSQWSITNISSGPDIGVCHVPKYAILNFCRVLAFLNTYQETSKKTGAEWALQNLPKEYKPVIQAAYDEYLQANSSTPVNCSLLKKFTLYFQEQISQAHITE